MQHFVLWSGRICNHSRKLWEKLVHKHARCVCEFYIRWITCWKVAYLEDEKHAKIAYFMIAFATACLLGLLGKWFWRLRFCRRHWLRWFLFYRSRRGRWRRGKWRCMCCWEQPFRWYLPAWSERWRSLGRSGSDGQWWWFRRCRYRQNPRHPSARRKAAQRKMRIHMPCTISSSTWMRIASLWASSCRWPSSRSCWQNKNIQKMLFCSGLRWVDWQTGFFVVG